MVNKVGWMDGLKVLLVFASAAPEEEGSDVLLAEAGALWSSHFGSAAQGKSTLEPLPAPKPDLI